MAGLWSIFDLGILTSCMTYNTALEKKVMQTQLAKLVEDLAMNLSAGKQTDLILLEFSTAFDKVNNSKLL